MKKMRKSADVPHMPGWERRLLESLEKHMLLLAVLLASLVALYLRKVAVWWNYEDIMGHFDHHINHTESSFYYLLLKLAEHIPILPLHSFKWLGGLADFALAAVCAGIAGGRSRLKQSVLYMLFLFSPVVFLRGIVWAQPDSAALLLLLAAYLLRKRYGEGGNRGVAFLGVLLAGTGVALSPCLLVVLLLYMASVSRKSGFAAGLGMAAAALLLQMVSALALGETMAEGFYSMFRFGTFHPLTGIPYGTPGEWLVQMMILFGLPASCISFMYSAQDTRDARPLLTAVAVSFVVTLLYASVLFPQ